MLYYVYFCTLAIVLFFGVKFAGLSGIHEDGLSLANSKAVLGIMAILIIFHHISQTEPFVTKNDIQYMQYVGILFVGAFFFFSGYGLIKSLKTKENYLSHFFRNRFVTILVPFILVNIIYLIVFSAFNLIEGEKPHGFIGVLKAVLGINLINGNAWYMIVIAMFYIIFYIAFRFMNEKIAFPVLLISIVVYVAVTLPKPHNAAAWFGGEWWYNTCFALFVGMIFARFEQQLLRFIKKFYYILLPVMLVLFVFSYNKNIYALNHYSYWCEWNPGITQAGIVHNRLICLGWQVLAYTSFVMVVVLLLLKLRFKNPVVNFLGKISLEIYLIHEIFLETLRTAKFYIKDNVTYVGVCIICTIIAAYLIYFISHLIEGLLLKGRTKKEA